MSQIQGVTKTLISGVSSSSGNHTTPQRRIFSSRENYSQNKKGQRVFEASKKSDYRLF